MSASIDARFDSANSRYGLAPCRARANQTWTSGLVVDSRKYGSPMVAASRPRISHDGFSAPVGFQ